MHLSKLFKFAAASALSCALIAGGSVAANAATHASLASVSSTKGHSANSRTVTFTGANFKLVGAVYLGSKKLAHFSRVSDTKITAVVDHSPNFGPGTYSFGLNEGGTTFWTSKKFQYVTTTNVDRQLRYLGANIDRKVAGSGYAYYPSNDCANFTSQTLHARGWAFTSSWKPGARNWVSSTALRSYLLSSKRVKEYSDTQANRAKVVVGDVIQFDWDKSGDRDHTGVITRIYKDSSGNITIYYSAHTDARPPHVNNSPSHDLTIEQSKINHEQYYKLKSPGNAYFLHIIKG